MKEEVKLFRALIIVFVLLVFTFVLTSCGDDSDNVYQTEYSIEFDRMGNLVVSSPKGALLVKPERNNKISIRIE